MEIMPTLASYCLMPLIVFCYNNSLAQFCVEKQRKEKKETIYKKYCVYIAQKPTIHVFLGLNFFSLFFLFFFTNNVQTK